MIFEKFVANCESTPEKTIMRKVSRKYLIQIALTVQYHI